MSIEDVDLEGFHTFSLLSGSDEFQIDRVSGEIRTLTILDREEQSFYQLVVVVFDGINMTTTMVNVTVTDVNDNDPVFGLDEYSAVIPEDFPLLTKILQVNATDADQSKQFL